MNRLTTLTSISLALAALAAFTVLAVGERLHAYVVEPVSNSLSLVEMAAPAVSASGTTRLYMDSTSHTLLASQNGGAYASLGGAAIPTSVELEFFGDGSDGALTSSTTLTRDMYYSSVTLGAGDVVNMDGYRMFVSGTLDLTAADAGAILARVVNEGVGGNASGTTGGTAGPTPIRTASASVSSQTAAPGAVGNVGANAGAFILGPGGAGNCGGGTGGTGGGSTNSGGGPSFCNTRFLRQPSPITQLVSARGGSGGGSGVATTGGSGGGGASGSYGVAIFARTISRGAGTTAGAINAVGSDGGDGSDATSGRGGGGGGGSGGAHVYIVAGELTGSTKTGAIVCTGGAGGDGGDGVTGNGGTGGTGGDGGTVTVIDMTANTVYTVDGGAGSAASAPSGDPGTVGGAGGTCSGDL